MDFTDTQTELIHQGIDGVVTDAEDRVGDRSGLTNSLICRGVNASGQLSITRNVFSARHKKAMEAALARIMEFDKVSVASEGEDFAVDGCAAVLALIFKIVLEVDNRRAADGFLDSAIR